MGGEGEMNELDVVALKADHPELGLKAGESGTIVMRLSETDILVEFSDKDGQEYAMPTLSVDDVQVVWRPGDAIAEPHRRAG